VSRFDPLTRPLRDPLRRALRNLRDGALVTVAGVLAYSLVFHLSVVRGASMLPGIRDGDRILVEPWSYLVDEVRRGDVVVLQSPLDPTLDYIKRVIGLPGEEVVVGPTGVLIDGRPLDEPYVVPEACSGAHQVRVAPGHLFVMGDNRPQSADSRDFGLVPCSALRGRVELRLWPPARIGLVH
jgi:signal peptidase I